MSCRFCGNSSCDCEKRITRTTSFVGYGRLCNQIIRNIATSFIAERIDLYVEYSSWDRMKRLGIPLYVGNKVYPYTIAVTDDNYMEVLRNAPGANIYTNEWYFQSREISQMIYDRLRSESVRNSIIKANPFRERYNANCDCFVHVRLGDLFKNGRNLGLEYYLRAIHEVGAFEGRLYVTSDSTDHEIVRGILDAYPGRSEQVLLDEVATIQFGSTCRHVVLSEGTFSGMIGWLAFFSEVYYPERIEGNIWHGDIFSVNSQWHRMSR